MIDAVTVPRRRRAYRDDGITATTVVVVAVVVVVVCGPSRRRRRRRHRRRRRRDDDSTHDNGPLGIIKNIVVVRCRPGGRGERTTRPRSGSLPTMDDGRQKVGNDQIK